MGLDQAIDITAEQRKIVLALLERHLPNTTAWVYGSRAKWASRPQSDLDLVVFATPEQIDQVGELREAFEESNLPFRVDLFVWADVPVSFRSQIEAEHVVLIERENCSSLGREWPTATIENLSDKVAMGPFGSSIKVSTFVPDGVPIISGQHLRGVRIDDSLGFNFITHEHALRLANANVKRGDIVFTHAGNIGQVAYIPNSSMFDRYVISQRQFYMRCDRSKAIPEFIAMFFKSSVGRHKLLANASQVGVPSIARPVTYLRTIEIPIPPLSEQRAIAHILGTLDDKIELNRRMNETLEAMARALFKDWLVDFGPTRAKVEGRAPYLAPEIWNLFPDAIDDEDTPVGWSFDTLARLAVTNSESWTARHHPPTVEYVDLSNTKWGNIEATTLLDWEAAPSRARRIAKAGDTIAGTTRPGNGSFAYISRDGLTVSTGFAVLSPRSAMYRDVVYIATTSVENIEHLANLADGHGGAYPAVKPNEVTDTVIVFPGDEVLASFADLVSPIREKIEHAKAESRTLAQTRDLLLPKLMSGEIRLAETEKAVEAVE